jgi:hypothetical protein
VDADATRTLAHRDAKQGAAGTYKGSFGFHPLLAAYLVHPMSFQDGALRLAVRE